MAPSSRPTVVISWNLAVRGQPLSGEVRSTNCTAWVLSRIARARERCFLSRRAATRLPTCSAGGSVPDRRTSACSRRPPAAADTGVIRTEVRLAAAEREAQNTAMSVRTEVRSLSVRDRLRLLEEIWDSLAEIPEAIPVTDAQRKELARRRRLHARDPSAAKPWAEVRARLRHRK